MTKGVYWNTHYNQVSNKRTLLKETKTEGFLSTFYKEGEDNRYTKTHFNYDKEDICKPA